MTCNDGRRHPGPLVYALWNQLELITASHVTGATPHRLIHAFVVVIVSSCVVIVECDTHNFKTAKAAMQSQSCSFLS